MQQNRDGKAVEAVENATGYKCAISRATNF